MTLVTLANLDRSCIFVLYIYLYQVLPDSLTMLRDTGFTYRTHISDCIWLAFAKLTEACERAPCVRGRGQGGKLGYVVHPQGNAFSVITSGFYYSPLMDS